MKAIFIDQNGKQNDLNFWGFYKKVTFEYQEKHENIVALVSCPEIHECFTVNPEQLLFRLKNENQE